jgi:hypothetical protein
MKKKQFIGISTLIVAAASMPSTFALSEENNDIESEGFVEMPEQPLEDLGRKAFTYKGFTIGLGAGTSKRFVPEEKVNKLLDGYSFKSLSRGGPIGGFTGSLTVGYMWSITPVFSLGAEANFMYRQQQTLTLNDVTLDNIVSDSKADDKAKEETANVTGDDLTNAQKAFADAEADKQVKTQVAAMALKNLEKNPENSELQAAKMDAVKKAQEAESNLENAKRILGAAQAAASENASKPAEAEGKAADDKKAVTETIKLPGVITGGLQVSGVYMFTERFGLKANAGLDISYANLPKSDNLVELFTDSKAKITNGSAIGNLSLPFFAGVTTKFASMKSIVNFGVEGRLGLSKLGSKSVLSELYNARSFGLTVSIQACPSQLFSR